MRKKRIPEHPMDRLERVCDFVKFRLNVRGASWQDFYGELHDGFEYSTRKNGRFNFVQNPKTYLLECINCKTVASPKKFTRLYGDYRIKNFEELGIKTGVCCWVCRNKLQPILDRLLQTELLLTQIRSAKRKLK